MRGTFSSLRRLMPGGIASMRKHLLNLFCLVILLLVTACTGRASTPIVSPPDSGPATQTPTPVVSQAELEKEEQGVYASFFKDSTGTIVIQKDTSTGWLPSSEDELKQRMDYIASGLPNASNETLDNFFQRNRQSTQLAPDMQLGIHYILVSADEFSAVMDQPNGWDAFYKKYSPSGYMQFSRVGFNDTVDQAIVYVGSIPGPMMGSGNYYLLEKKGGQWSIREQVLAWVS
jgi:hypothetical protein